MTLREAAENLLEAWDKGTHSVVNAFDTLRAALAEPDEAAAEREACARMCEQIRPSKREYDHRFYDACTASAAVIRARGLNAN